MALTALEIKDKTFGVKFRGYDANEVEEFLDIVVRDYEDLVRLNHDQEAKIQALEERLNYFDEMKDSLSQSVLIAQDTAERVKQAANECNLTGNISCHSLRKTFGFFAWKQGTQPALLMAIYNHSSYNITQRYLGITQLEKDAIYMNIHFLN